MKYIEHTFGPGQTVCAVIFLKNHHNLTNDEKDELVDEFIRLNDHKVLHLGESVKIPILPRNESIYNL